MLSRKITDSTGEKMDYIQILKDLISIDTSVPPGKNYGKAVGYLKPLFEQVGFTTEVIDIPPEQAEGQEGRVNLLCHRRFTTKPRLIFYGHIDVVPAQGWDAFQPRVENGKIFGRGAADMKGALPALLLALEKCRNKTLKFDTSVMITTDEECSQASQLRYLGRFLQPLRGAYVFDLDSNFGYVSIASLGTIQMDILVKGKSIHSALSHLGINAVENANLLMNALVSLKNEVAKRKSAVPAHPATGLDRMVARLNINMIQGGLKGNIIPDQCTITIDRRLIPEENIARAREETLATLSAVEGVEWEIAREFSIPPVLPCQDPITEELAGILRQVTGEGGRYGEMGSGDVANIVVNEWEGREFGLGVIRPESNMHGNNEFVYQKDIEDLAEIIFRFLTA
jgi:succinyl-diaminopimelate desuccinylase